MAYITVLLINVVAIIAFSALAWHFNNWWIALFALLFSVNLKHEGNNNEDRKD